MANSVTMKSDTDLVAMLGTMKTEFNRRVIRSSAFAGIKVFKARAYELAPVYSGPPKFYVSGKPVVPGTLRDSIYNVFDDARSSDKNSVYTVSWNHPKAGHGHWIEYGHWYRRTKGGPALKWVPPRSFIRAAEDVLPKVFAAVRERAYQRFDELMIDAVTTGNLSEFKLEVGA